MKVEDNIEKNWLSDTRNESVMNRVCLVPQIFENVLRLYPTFKKNFKVGNGKMV